MDIDEILDSIDEEAIEDAAMELKDSVVAAAIDLLKSLVVIIKNYVAAKF